MFVGLEVETVGTTYGETMFDIMRADLAWVEVHKLCRSMKKLKNSSSPNVSKNLTRGRDWIHFYGLVGGEHKIAFNG